METTQQTAEKPAATESCCAPAAKSGWFNGRNVLIGATLLAAAALYFGWNWLAAAGLASIVLGVLPCLVMCALGVCAARMSKKDTVQSNDAARKETP